MANEFFAQLRKDHREVKDLLEKLHGGDGNRGELFEQLKKELMPHLKAEEKVFYQALMGNEDAREDTLEGFEEHHVTELVFNEMVKMPQSDERWSAKLSVLKELIEHHVKEEEGKVFKLAKQKLNPGQFPKFLEEFEQEKEKIKQKMK